MLPGSKRFMKSNMILMSLCIVLLSSFIGCKDIAGNIKAGFGKLTQGITAAKAGKFGNTAEEQAMIKAVTDRYGDLRQPGDHQG